MQLQPVIRFAVMQADRIIANLYVFQACFRPIRRHQRLDANALFYLRTRGLGPDEARQALITAFLHATLALIKPEDLGVRVAARLQSRLEALDGAAI